VQQRRQARHHFRFEQTAVERSYRVPQDPVETGKNKAKGKVQKSKGKSEGQTTMAQLDYGSAHQEGKQIQIATHTREFAGIPESRVAFPASRVSTFCLLTFALCLLTCSFSYAAERPHLITQWENFTTANGMPDAKVFCVTVDGPRVWAGTEDGLVLIENGKVAKVYRPADGFAAPAR